MSKIEWCDHTISVQIGCARVSAGCEHCYAEALANSLPVHYGKVHSRYLKVVDGKGRWNREIYLDGDMLDRGPTTPRRKKTATGWRSPRVFIGPMTDHFHEKVTPDMLDLVLRFMAQRPGTIWQMVTKRPHRAAQMLPARRETWTSKGWDWPRIHLLTTTEDQQRAEERVPQLLKCEPYVELLGLSVEPLLERVELAPQWLERLKWLIVGGESGPKARPCDIDWIRSVVKQGADAGVATFTKQLGSNPWSGDAHVMLKHPKGGKMAEWPADLQVQEFPR